MSTRMLKFYFVRNVEAHSVRSKLRNSSILSQVIAKKGDNVLLVHVPDKTTDEQMQRMVTRLAGATTMMPFSHHKIGDPMT